MYQGCTKILVLGLVTKPELLISVKKGLLEQGIFAFVQYIVVTCIACKLKRINILLILKPCPMKDDVYRQLQRHLDKMPVPFPETESGVEISLLKRLFDEEEAYIALNLSALPESVIKFIPALRKRRSVKSA